MKSSYQVLQKDCAVVFCLQKHQGLTARPYSPDLALRDFFSPFTIKIKLKGRRYDTRRGDLGRIADGAEGADTKGLLG